MGVEKIIAAMAPKSTACTVCYKVQKQATNDVQVITCSQYLSLLVVYHVVSKQVLILKLEDDQYFEHFIILKTDIHYFSNNFSMH